MKKIKSFRIAIVLVTAILLLTTSCSKDRSAVTEKNARVNNSVRDIDPGYDKNGAVKGYVLPADAKAIVSLTDLSTGSYYSVAADNTGLFYLQVPAGKYVFDAIPNNPDYESVQFDVLVAGGNTLVLTITLPKKTDSLYK